MKILVFCEDFPPRIGGIQTHSLNLSLWLFRKGMEITVITSSGDGSETTDQGLPFPVIRLPMDKKGISARISYFLRAIRAVGKEKPELAICTHAFRYCGLMNWIKVLWGLPFILFAHGKEIYPGKRGKRRRKVIRLCKGADKIIAVSHYTKQLLASLNIPAEKVMVIPNGFYLPKADKQIIASLKTRHQLEEKPILLTVSRLIKRKGHQFVLDVLPEVKKKYPKLVYLIVGEGKERQALERKVKKLRLSGNVIFTGKVSSEELAAFYALCDIFIMLSYEQKGQQDVEGFGIVYLEAGAFGKPVIGHRAGGVEDAVLHNETGLLIDNLHAEVVSRNIFKLLDNPRLSRELGENGYRRINSKFSWDRIADQIISVCENVVANS